MINLFVSYYQDSVPERQREIDTCFTKNLANQYIDNIYVLVDEIPPPRVMDHPKIKGVFHCPKPKYNDFFEAVNRVTEDVDINIIANLDIYFENDLKKLYWYNLDRRCLALSRWDIGANGRQTHHRSWDSQDVWIFKGKVNGVNGDHRLGICGCDNRIAHEIKAAGYEVLNPSDSFKCFHLHITNVHNYTRRGGDVVPEPYHFITPHDDRMLLSGKKVLHLALGRDQPTLEDALSSLGEIKNIDHCRNKNFFAEALSQKWDVVFMQVQSAGVVTPEFCQRLTGVRLNWTGDVRQPTPQWYLDVGRVIDNTLFTNTDDVRYLHQHGIGADYLQIGFDHHVFVPYGEQGRYPDVVFMANNYRDVFPLSPLRAQIAQRLRDEFSERFEVIGTGWPFKTRSLMYNMPEEAKAYRSCKIAINCSHFDLRRYSSDRILRIMGAGAFCLTKWYPDIEMEYQDGVHLKVFRTLDEMVDMVRYYLENENERKKIAMQGCEYVHRNCRWQNRMDQLKAIIAGS